MPHLRSSAWITQLARLATWCGVCALPALLRAAEPAASFDFNGPATTWQIVDDDRIARVLIHECRTGGARDAAGFEQIALSAPGGQSVQLLCPSPPIAVIEELEVRLWVKANRPDIQLAARIALPRATSEDDEAGASALVRGAKYSRPGHWQQLVLKNVPKQLAAEVRILRARPGAKIDTRGAFLDAIVLVVPGDPEGVEIATDDLIIDGILIKVSDEIQLTAYPAPAAVPNASPAATPPVAASLRRLPTATSAAEPIAAAQLHGDLLLVGNKPFVPRAIQWRGEPLQYLVERGFNTVWLDQSPTAEQSAEARNLGLWFISKPPRPEALARDGLGPHADRVIAWFLDDPAIESDPSYAPRWADLVHEKDTAANRPVVIAPQAYWNSASKTADILLASRAQVSLLTPADYDAWLTKRWSLIHPGTPVWTHFNSQVGATAGQQISALSGMHAEPPNMDAAHLRSLVHVACTRGARGFVFHSDSPLNASDHSARTRATTLELINRRIQRLEPWLASGKVIGRYSSSDPAWSACVLHVDRAQLLIPMLDAAAPKTTAREVTFTVPGVSESCQVFAFSPIALKTVPIQRVAGGTRFGLRPEDDTFLLMTEDPKVVQSLRQYISRYGERTVRLQRDQAALLAAAVNESARRLATTGANTATSAQLVASANAQLQQVDAGLASRQLEPAYQAANNALRLLEQSATNLTQSASGPQMPLSNPLALSSDRLAEFAAFERAYPSFQAGENLLYGGDFEDLGQLTQFGWQHFSDRNPNVDSKTELSTDDPRHGSYCLMLQSTPRSASQDVIGTPAWVVAPALPVTAGQVLEIVGWVRVDPATDSSGDVLQIVDSLGGPELMLSIQQTNGWERFRMIRAVPDSAELRVTFAMAGAGTAKVDAVMVRKLEQPPPARRLPILAPANGSPPASASNSFVTPQTR